MKLIAYVNFDGRCAEAFRFYQRCLRGEIVTMTTFGETPARDFVPAESHGHIMHACLTVGDQTLMGADSTPEHPYEGVKGCSVALTTRDPAEAERIFAELSEGGTVAMPLQETFWAVKFGYLIDQFGVPWLINCEKPA